MAEDIGSIVAGLGGKMDMVVDMLRRLDEKLDANYMPSAQIEDRFKSQGERIGAEEKARIEDIKMIRETLKTMDQDVKDKFIAIALSDKENATRKKESPYKIIAALGGLIVIIGGVISGVIWLIHVVK